MRNTIRNRKYVTATLLVGVLWAALTGMAAAEPFTISFDPLNPDHRALMEPLFGTPFHLGPDPEGNIVFMIGEELASVPSDTYELRHVILNTDDLAEFTFEFEARGWATGSGNPSHFVIFGWQDYKNYYYTYPAESPESRVARVVDGQHQTLYRHGENTWARNRDSYQSIRVELKTVDGKSVVNTYVNGDLAMTYTFAEGQEPPTGKVGISMWNNVLHSAYYRNISLSAK